MRTRRWSLVAALLMLAGLTGGEVLAGKGGNSGGKPGGGGGEEPPPAASAEIAYWMDGDLYVTDADGAVQTFVVSGSGSHEASWSPDGERIAFANTSGLYVVDVDGSGLTQLYAGFTTSIAWSPSRSASVPQKIVFRAGGGLQLINPDGTGRQILTKAPDRVESGPAWSPDGTRIAVRFNEKDRRIDENGDTIWYAPVAGLEIYDLAFDGDGMATVVEVESVFEVISDFEAEPPVDATLVGFTELDWSPDGIYLAYTDYVEAEEQYDVWLIEPDAAVPTPIRLTDTPFTDERCPGWSPEGARLVFDRQSGRKQETGLYILDIVSTGISSLGIKSGRFPDWKP